MQNKTAAALRPVSLMLDVMLAGCLFIFLTGFIPFAPEKIYAVFDQKPALHRILVLAAALIGLSIVFFQKESSRIYSAGKDLAIFTATRPWILFLTAGSIWTYAAWMRHDAFKSGFDMAIFTQAIWNTTRGDFLYSSIKGGICLLGDHFSPLLALFALLYKIWPEPHSLLLLQAFAGAAGVFPIHRLMLKKTNDSFWALSAILAFCLYLPLRNSVRFEFHPEIAAIPLLLWAYVFLTEKKLWKSSLMLALALSAKENLATVAFAVGLYAFFSRNKIFGLFWMVFSAAYFHLATRVWIPAMTGEEYFYLSGNFMAWKDQGAQAFLLHLLNASTAAYLVKIYLPAGFLSFLYPSFILNLPALAQNLVSRNEMTRSIFYQYTATLTPFVFISAAETLKRFYPRRFFLFFFLFSSVLMAGVSDLYIAAHFRAEKTPDLEGLDRIFQSIPKDASVRTHEFFAAHLASRKELHIFENNHPKEGGSQKALNADYIILHRRLLGSNAESVLTVLKDKYRVSEQNGLLILQKS